MYTSRTSLNQTARVRKVIQLTSSDEDEEPESDRELSREERVVQVLLTVLLPLVITGIAFGVIVVAYAQWKLY